MDDAQDSSKLHKSQHGMKRFDDILTEIGEFGLYQKILMCLVSMNSFFLGFTALAQVFLAGEADHWCRVPAWDQDNCTVSGDPDDWDCLLEKRDASIPRTVTDSGDVVFDTCYMYDVSYLPFTPGLNPTDYTNSTIPCSQWVHDTTQYKSTIITEFNLVCGSATVTTFLQAVYFAGYLVGSFFFGSLSDCLGRKPVIFIAAIIFVLASFGNTFSPSIAVYMCLRFFMAAGGMGSFLAGYVLVTEFIGPNQLSKVSMLMEFFFPVGLTILPLLAYWLRYWRQLQFATAVPVPLFFLIYFFVPESPRWQMAKGRYRAAEKTLRRAAAWNKTTLSDDAFSPEAVKAARESLSGKQNTVLELFRSPNMALKTVNIMFNWFVNSMVYYGLALNTSNLGVGDYLASLISGLIEFPSNVYCLIAIMYFSRRINLSGTMIIGGTACIVTAFLEPGIPLTCVAMVGKFMITASFAIIYVVSVEIYPTPVRSAGMGLSSTAARVSSIMSPYILEVKSVWAPLPFLIFGVLAIIAGLLALFLPETKNRLLPETLEDGEAFGKPKCLGGKGLLAGNDRQDEEDDEDNIISMVKMTQLDNKDGVDNENGVDNEAFD